MSLLRIAEAVRHRQVKQSALRGLSIGPVFEQAALSNAVDVDGGGGSGRAPGDWVNGLQRRPGDFTRHCAGRSTELDRLRSNGLAEELLTAE